MLSLTFPKRDERGFTLIELLVVIIIIGILAAIAIPLFLDQRKLAVDASVKSDVRNTATQVQTWLATTPGQIATDAADYASKGGNVSKSTGNTVKLSVATDGSYLVCGYAGTAAKAYTATTAAYVYDSTTGKFGLGDCASGIVGAGSPSTTTSPTATPTPTPTVAPIFSHGFEANTLTGGMTMVEYPGASRVISAATAHAGSGYELLSGKGAEVDINFPKGSFPTGTTYTYSIWVRASSASSTDTWFGASNGATSKNVHLITTDTDWHQMSLTVPGMTSASPGYIFLQNYAGGPNVLVDDFTVTTS